MEHILERTDILDMMGSLKLFGSAAQDLAGKLGLREMTGRGRYRAWGFL